MSEDTAHGQHFEPPNGNAESIPQEIPSLEEVLHAQAERVGNLGLRTAALLDATRDAFNEFTLESAFLFKSLQELAEVTREHSTANSASEKASS